jgi:hypothetical protein
VWQDSDSDGAVDAGELQSLTAVSIASISLSSDGVPYSAAGGDVSVVGTGSYTRADGSTGVLADAVFVTGARPADEQLRAAVAANSNVALIGAVAAAGLVAVPAAAHDGFESRSPMPESGQASAAASLGTVASSLSGDAARPALSGESREALDDNLVVSSSMPAREAPTTADASAVGDMESARSPLLSELLQGTERAAHDDIAASGLTAGGVAMPSAAMLQAAMQGAAGEVGEAVAGEAHSTAEVARVLADALGGGGQAPDIDALLGNLGHEGPNGLAVKVAPEDVAGAAAMWGMHAFNAFAHGAMVPEALALHQDAPPQA